MQKLVLFVALAILLVSCQTSAPLPLASVVPIYSSVPSTTTNTPKQTFTLVPSTPTPKPISTLSGLSAEVFIEYDSTRYISENGLSTIIPVFSVRYPPEWKYGWFGDGVVTIKALVISSVDPSEAFTSQDTSGPSILIVPRPYNGEKLTDLFVDYARADKIIEEPISFAINGQEATRVRFVINDQKETEVIIVREKWALDAIYSFPIEKESEFLPLQPLLEEIISTITIK